MTCSHQVVRQIKNPVVGVSVLLHHTHHGSVLPPRPVRELFELLSRGFVFLAVLLVGLIGVSCWAWCDLGLGRRVNLFQLLVETCVVWPNRHLRSVGCFHASDHSHHHHEDDEQEKTIPIVPEEGWNTLILGATRVDLHPRSYRVEDNRRPEYQGQDGEENVQKTSHLVTSPWLQPLPCGEGADSCRCL